MFMNRKVITPVIYDVKNSKQSFSSVIEKLTTLGLFLLKIKIKQKRKLVILLFYGENNSKEFKNCHAIRPESPPSDLRDWIYLRYEKDSYFL